MKMGSYLLFALCLAFEPITGAAGVERGRPSSASLVAPHGHEALSSRIVFAQHDILTKLYSARESQRVLRTARTDPAVLAVVRHAFEKARIEPPVMDELLDLIFQNIRHPAEGFRLAQQRLAALPHLPMKLDLIAAYMASVKRRAQAAYEALAGTEVIADLGAGDGYFAKNLLTLAAQEGRPLRLIASDFDTRYWRQKPSASLEFRRHWGPDDLPYQNDEVGAAVLSKVIHHMTPKRVTLLARELARILKTNGRLVIIENAETAEAHGAEHFFALSPEQRRLAYALVELLAHEVIQPDGSAMTFNFLPLNALSRPFVEAGFQIERISSLQEKPYEPYEMPRGILVMRYLGEAA